MRGPDHASMLELSFASANAPLSVRSFTALERASDLFECDVQAVSDRSSLDLAELVGSAAELRVSHALSISGRSAGRVFRGVCTHAEQVRVEPDGVSTYHVRIAPALWLLTQRTDHRIFQRMAIPEIVGALLDEWRVPHAWRFDMSSYPKLDYRVQYGETDYAFVSRLLEEVGIAFVFEAGDAETRVVFDDALGACSSPSETLPFVDQANAATGHAFGSRVRFAQVLRPSAMVLRDHDLRRPAFELEARSDDAQSGEDRLEQRRYAPGAFLRIRDDEGGGTPTADDKGAVRHDAELGGLLAARALESLRADRRRVSFATNVAGLEPGTVFAISEHPHASLARDVPLLVTELSTRGSIDGPWSIEGRAVFAGRAYRPSQKTQRPDVSGVQSATVVGPPGEEIHTDELGRVRVRFPWDRSGRVGDTSSCWIRVSQGWAGAGYGSLMLPRVGQEVLVGFLDGDPDQPVVVGRVFNALSPHPYALPEHKTRSTWRSASSPGGAGHNEILFEDLAGAELLHVHAQRDLRQLVQNDETTTVGNNRSKLVKNDELEATGGSRIEVTQGDRTEITRGERLQIVGGRETRFVKDDVREHVAGSHRLRIDGSRHVVVKGASREEVRGDRHATIEGDRVERVGGGAFLEAGAYAMKTGGSFTIEAGDEIHIQSAAAIVLEAPDITLKAPGGFVRIDGGGVTIVGTLVRINSGGAAGSASGGTPAPEVQRPVELSIDPPQAPAFDDVSDNPLGRV
ncbi:MAG: type VI secretion system tip protein VgrG [Polyangiaceae bacterium]|nr:type VI secretion system tip protein VgrG [Polyangiaceae bacterium]